MHFIWHEMFKIASASGAPSQTPLGSLRRSPRPSSREGLFAFVNRSLVPRALALPNFLNIYSQKLYLQIYASGVADIQPGGAQCIYELIMILMNLNNSRVIQTHLRKP